MAQNNLGFPIPDGVAGDALIFTVKDKELHVVLIGRKDKVESGLAIPGGFLDLNENIKTCVIREAKEEIDLDLSNEKLILVGEYSDPDRDKRGRNLSIVYGCKISRDKLLDIKPGDDAKEIKITRVQDILDGKIQLAFDHNRIIEECAFHPMLGVSDLIQVPEKMNTLE